MLLIFTWIFLSQNDEADIKVYEKIIFTVRKGMIIIFDYIYTFFE